MASRPYAVVTGTADAQNEWTDVGVFKGHFNISISGISGDTVTLQRAFDDVPTWKDVASYTADAEDVHYEPETNVQYRLGVKTGDYSAGTVLLRLSQ